MVRHDWTRMYLTLVGECLEPVLNAVFVAWPLECKYSLHDVWFEYEQPNAPPAMKYLLDGQDHCLWGPAVFINGIPGHVQQGKWQGIWEKSK